MKKLYANRKRQYRNRKTLIVADPDDCDCCGPAAPVYYVQLTDCCTGVSWYVRESQRALYPCLVIVFGGRCYSWGGRFPVGSIPPGSVLIDTLPGATCSPDDCGDGFCRTLCPDPCCVQQWLPRCDGQNPTVCCKLGQTATVTYRYRRIRVTECRAMQSVQLSVCPNAIPCPTGTGAPPDTGVIFGVLRSRTTIEEYTLVLRFSCNSGPTCESFTKSTSDHGFTCGPVVVGPDGCSVTDVPQFWDEDTAILNDCTSNQIPPIPSPIPSYYFLDGSGMANCFIHVDRTDVDPAGQVVTRVQEDGAVSQNCQGGSMDYSLSIVSHFCTVRSGSETITARWSYEVSGGNPCPPAAGDCGVPMPPPGTFSRSADWRGWKAPQAATVGPVGVLGAGDFL